MFRTTIAVAGAAILVGAAAAASFRVYAVRDEGGGTALWNTNDAYFFSTVWSLGFSPRYLECPWILFKSTVIGGFAAVASPDSSVGSLVVIEVTSSGVKQHTLKLEDRGPGSGPGQFTPRHGYIYANYPALGGLCRWTGDNFEPASREERSSFDGIRGLTAKDFDPGWHGRSFGIGLTDSKFTIEVDGSSKLSLNSIAEKTGHGSISLDLLRPGKAPERIWDLDLRRGKVCKDEYQRTFQQ